MRKIELTKDEVWAIATTPPRECWVCEELVKHIEKKDDKRFIDVDWLVKEGFVEHLAQIIGKEKLKEVL